MEEQTVLNDIENRTDLEFLFQEFYNSLLSDSRISYFFTDVVQVNFETHLPLIVDFWEMTLFSTNAYSKNLMEIHTKLAKKSSFTTEHFDIWLNTLNTTIDQNFSGENANLAKERALSIATVLKIKTL